MPTRTIIPTPISLIFSGPSNSRRDPVTPYESPRAEWLAAQSLAKIQFRKKNCLAFFAFLSSLIHMAGSLSLIIFTFRWLSSQRVSLASFSRQPVDDVVSNEDSDLLDRSAHICHSTFEKTSDVESSQLRMIGVDNIS